ncbi:cupin domain-containing protein [Niabella drilacis]|uniref:Cupin domain-containing protein n=1 Tax=Niabella drilacis (strain DSM 25811 / CCM 8410 / CCUG 62505 / LMG 26954 / E90) TaxID=1285928 RepID=A0A1G7ASV5_NIADE|nr:cupin domain-containing protein [Niabella drilacis]SDE17770.1 Cupin domain-containing protein [Niabella drilacis]
MPTRENKVVSDAAPVSSYYWGTGGEAFVLSSNPRFSIKKEQIPPGTGEQLHLHNKATQFFYIITGVGSFEIDQRSFLLNAGQGIEIFPGQPHRIFNQGTEQLEFLVFSHPLTEQDRLNL